jgi:pyruvate/2-oxoglutarate/acetoin dehydrogenase E1 component
MDTPISETGFIGAATGAALSGMRPIVELMFVDFFGVCMDQIYNHMAKIHYESGGNFKVPVVITTAIGGGYSDGAQHSQTLYGMFAHLPGLKIVVPSTPYDAKGLMISAIRDDNPVLYMFHKGVMGLGWMTPNPRATGDVPEEPYTVPIGKADVKRSGRDLTIVTVSLMVHRALDAADDLAKDGIEAEVLDLRSVIPLDREAILESVRKTRRLLVVDEDYRSFGMSGEVITSVVEGAFDYLDAPPARLALPDVPIPYSRPLEQFVLPNRVKIAAAARALVAKK